LFVFTNGVAIAPGIKDGAIFGIEVAVDIRLVLVVVVLVLIAGNKIGDIFDVLLVLILVENEVGELVGNEAGIKGVVAEIDDGGLIKEEVTVGSISNEAGRLVGKIICPFVNIFLIK